MYVLNFDGSKIGKERYEICIQSVFMTTKEVTNENEDEFIFLLRKLKSIGVEAAERIGKVKLYDLQDGGGEIGLERSEHKLLLTLIGLPIWRPAVLEQKKECQEWVKNIKPVDGGGPQDAALRKLQLEKGEGKADAN